ncbi:MAG: TolC family protein, partial [Vicinamibacterales bacterium]
MRSRIPAATVLAVAIAVPAAAQIPGGGMPAQNATQAPPARPQPSQPQTNPFMGGVPKGTVQPGPLNLSLKDALQRALQNNLGLLVQEESAASAHGARWRALADLLPNVTSSVTESRQVINLEAYGFPLKPPIVGPFNVFDARMFVSQPIVNLSALNGARAASYDEQAAKYGIKSARDLVVLVAVNLYLEGVSAQSRVQMTQAQQDTADALLKQAQDLKGGGLVAGIDVLRAQVQVQTERQRVIAAQNEFEKVKLQLARAIGIPVAQPITLTDKIPYAPMPSVTLEDALNRALTTRPDYLAAETHEKAAEADARAASDALLPSVRVDANYGAIGQTTSDAHSTYTLSASVQVPIFDAGRTVARRIEANAALRESQAELADLKSSVEYDVRAALLDARAAEQQLQAAQTNVQLAASELQEARDRFAAGVANNLEVTQAQEAVATANDTYISALYTHNLAKASLARAIGIAESAVTGY